MHRQLSLLGLLLCVSACNEPASETATPISPETQASVADTGDAAPASTLDEIIAALPEAAQARVPYRHPKETLNFFGVEPGMTVVDTVPGDIWYTGILADYLGTGGKVIGADRPIAVWEYFGPDYATPELLARQKKWPSTWPADQAQKQAPTDVSFEAVTFSEVPTALAGTVDMVMMVRELHNIMAADQTGALANTVLGEISMMLKPGGVFAVVQHRAPESASDAWANGEAGYLKQSKVIAVVEAAGFTLEAVSEINANPKDQPTEKDIVWRLPPGLDVPEGDADKRAQMIAIGESDRMTLKFRKKA